jgi:hypothetical protein
MAESVDRGEKVDPSEKKKKERSDLEAFLRHPLVVGAAVAIIGAFFASLLIPSITQVTQDRPKELELKRSIVDRITGSTGVALGRGEALAKGYLVAAGGQPGQKRTTVYHEVRGNWQIARSTIDGEMTTYFGHGHAWAAWIVLRDSVTSFLVLSSSRDPSARRNARIQFCGDLRPYLSSSSRGALDGDCKDPKTLLSQERVSNKILSLEELLTELEDSVTVRIVDEPAKGFRHSPWSLH